MKFTWILVLISTMTIIKCKPADTKDHLSETNTALAVETNKTIHLLERRSKNAINKRKKFLMTFKPHVYIYRRHRRFKKKKPMRNTQKYAITTNITKSNHNYKNSRNIFEEYIDKTNGNQQITNSYENKIKELTENNTHSESKSKGEAKRESVKCLRKCCKFKNIFKNNNCLSKFKRFGRQYLSNRSIRFIKDAGNHRRIYGNLQEKIKKSVSDRVVDSTQSLVRSIKTSTDSLIRSKLGLVEKEINKTSARLKNDENINNSSRLKRSVNIIEEEGMATTSSGFRFTGQDTSIHSNFIYKNIHN